MNTHRYLLLAGVASLVLAAPAYAQDAPQKPADQPTEAPAATDADKANPDDIVVTAERRPQSLQSYAGTAAVLSPTQLARVGIVNIENLNDTLPGLRVQNFNGAIDIALRGIGTNQNTELGDPNVATHFDDVYVPRVQGLANSYFDLKAVEVNFGPQGTLRGRNASAGSLNFISWAPELGKFLGNVEVGAGNFNQASIRGVFNVPLGDHLAFRISGSADRHGSYYRNVGRFPQVAAPYADDNRGVRAQLLWEPTTRLSILIAGDYNKQDSTGFNGSNYSKFLDPATVGGFANAVNSVKNPRDIITGPLGEQYSTEHSGIRARVTYRTDGLFNVQYIGSHRDLRTASDGAGPASVAYPGFEQDFYGIGGTPLQQAVGAERSDNYGRGLGRGGSFSDFHELRFFNDSEPLKYSVGGNYFNERQRTLATSVSDYNSFFQGQEFNTKTKSETFAFYGDATYSVTSKLRLTGGLRYTNDSKSRTGVISRLFFGGGDANFGCCGYFRLGTPGFEFNTNRTIFDVARNPAGEPLPGAALAFFLDGVKSFGARDTIPIAFADAIARLRANPALANDPNFGFANGAGCINSATNPGYVCRADGNFTYNFVAHTINNQASKIRTDFIDWRARLEYDLSDDNLVYGVVSSGHKAASFNDNLGSLGPAPFFRPEKVTLFELGTKNEFTVGGRKAVLNLSAFYNDYKDQQLTALLGVTSIVKQLRIDPNDPNSPLVNVTGPQNVPNGFAQNQVVAFTYNAANSETYGIQGSGSIILPARFKLGADFLWLEGRIKDAAPVQDFRFQADVAGTEDSKARPIAGRRLPYTPRFQLNASLAKVIPVGGSFGGSFDGLISVSWRSSSFATIFNSIDFNPPAAGPRESLNDRIPYYYLVNMAVGYTHGNFRVEAYVNNLFDNTVAAGLLVNQFNNTRFFTNPRLAGGRVRITF